MSDPLNRSRREARRRRKLGPEACCFACGETNPTVLQAADKTLLDRHHVVGHAHAPDLTVAVCRNCHAIFSAAQSDDEVPLDPQPTLLERIVAILLALASFFRVLIDALVRRADELKTLITHLNAQYPAWRRIS